MEMRVAVDRLVGGGRSVDPIRKETEGNLPVSTDFMRFIQSTQSSYLKRAKCQ